MLVGYMRALCSAIAIACLGAPSAAVPLLDDGQGFEIAAVSQSASIAGTWEFLDRLHERSASTHLSTTLSGSHGFLSGYGDRTRWDEGVRSRRSGLAAGFQTGTDGGLGAGFELAAGTAHHEALTPFARNRSLASEFVAAVHARLAVPEQHFVVTLAAGRVWSLNDFSRANATQGTLVAQDVASDQWMGSAELRHEWAPMTGLALTGFARADATRLSQAAYEELPLDNATLSPARVDGAATWSARSLLGARAALSMATGKRSTTLSVRTAWSHEFETDRSVRFSRELIDPLSGNASAVWRNAAVTQPGNDSFLVGASVEAAVTDAARIYLGYNTLFASARDSQSAEAGLRVSW